jgi:hypothetical protein
MYDSGLKQLYCRATKILLEVLSWTADAGFFFSY